MSKLLGVLSLLLVILLCLNGRVKKMNCKRSFLLKKYHTYIVILVLVLSLIHGILACKTNGMLSGKIAWMLLFVSLLVIPSIKTYKLKMKIHHILSTMFLIVCISHIIFLW